MDLYDDQLFMDDHDFDAAERELLNTRIGEQREARKELMREFNKPRRRFARWLHRMADKIGQ